MSDKPTAPTMAQGVGDPYADLAKQCEAEYNLSWLHQKDKKDEWAVRLKLYNNQKRDKEAVGDTTMFTILQTVLASLYVDRLMVNFGGREEGDDEQAENLNAMAEYDYEDMGKDETDYYWDWDTLFFGRGILDCHTYLRDPDKNIFLPVGEVVDPIILLRDPRAVSFNGNKLGSGAARWFGWETKMNKQAIEESEHKVESFTMDQLKFGTMTKSLLSDATEARDQAQGRQTQKMLGEENLGANAEYDIVRWHTWYKIDGKVQKVRVWLANQMKKVIGVQILGDDNWKMVDRPLYPTSHDWDGTSIPDLTEDKQRARAVAQNLGLRAMKADLYPMYIYDSNRITNRHDLDFNFNKFIPMDAQGKPVGESILPLRKAMPNMPLLNFIYTSLDISAQKATATPDIQQGIQSEKDRTLGETNLIAGNVDTRYSLAAKVFGWSERAFWQQYYWSYKENFAEDIDEKMVRIVSAFGAKFRPFTKENLIPKHLDPDIKIESQILSRAKMMEERQSMTSYLSLALQDPTSNRRYGLKTLGKLNGMKKDEIERLFPATIDERIAEDQNVFINRNELVPVLTEDDHNVHLEIHSKAADTPAKAVHVETHKRALSLKKAKPELFPQEPEAATFQPAGTEKLTPTNMATKPIAPSKTA